MTNAEGQPLGVSSFVILPSSFAAPRRSGFTLLEALAALLLVAIVLPVLVGAVYASSNMGALARDRSEAALLAEAKLQEMLLTGEWRFGDTSGTFESPDVQDGDPRDWRWVLLVEPAMDPSVSQLTLSVTWVRRNRDQSVDLTTIAGGGGGL